MFNQLVESGSHRADFARRGTFFVGTLACYAVLLVGAGVASVFAYDAQLDRQNLEVTLLTALPPEQQPRVQPEHATEPRPNTGSSHELPMRVALVADIRTPLMPTEISNRPSPIPPMPSDPVVLGPINYDPPGGLNKHGTGNGTNAPGADGIRVQVPDAEDVAPPAPTPAPTPKPVPTQVRLTSYVISSKVISKPVPVYPIIAKQARIFGMVTVEILVDEQGRVISAQATSGHPLLREAARQAALQARFSPTLLSQQPVKVSGMITYNFVLQ